MKEYFEKYRSHIFCVGLFVFLLHGAKLYSGIVGIDTEDIIHSQYDLYVGWLNTGRQGLWLLKWLTGSLSYQPFMAGLLTLIFMTIAVVAMFMLWDGVPDCKKENKILPWILGGLFFCSHPVITEQFYFSLQSVEICIGFGLNVLALYLVKQYTERKKIGLLLCSIPILVLTFSLYQIFVVIFIFGTVSVLFTDALYRFSGEDGLSGKELLGKLLPYVSVFSVAFVINTIITNLFFNTSDYLGGQILWGKFVIKDNIKAILGHVFRTLTGTGNIHYHWSFGLLVLFMICMVAVILLRNRTKHKNGACFTLIFYGVSLLATPFLMTVVCGVAPAIRSQLILPLLTGFLAYSVCKLLILIRADEQGTGSAGKVAGIIFLIVSVLGIWHQTATTMSLYYTAEMCYEQDEHLGRALIMEIDKVQGEELLPVAVIGTREFRGNNACLTGEIIGVSFFCHDADVEPAYYWSTRRVLGFFHVLGADYPQVGREQMGTVLQYGSTMPVWPAEGSIQVYNGMIIVKLSETE